MKKHPLPSVAFCALVLVLAFASPRPAEAFLIGYWPFDEDSGEAAADAIGGNNGIWQNPGNNLAWVAGVNGNAADLGGQVGGNNYFQLSLDSALQNATGLTLSAWINPDGATGSNYEGIFTTRSSVTGTAIGNANWGFSWETDPAPPHLDSRTGGAVDSTDPVEVGGGNAGWFHIALVWDGVAGTHTQYVNGVATSGGGPVGDLSGGTWQIGHDDCCGGNRDFDGQIDDLAVWDEALSEQDIADLFAMTKVPTDINPPTDNDMDGLPNAYEEMFPGFLDPEVADADQDVDRVGGVLAGDPMPDGLDNAAERAAGTDPRDPDSDDDTILDGEEVMPGEDGFVTDPLSDDTDDDNVPDNVEISNANGFVTDPTKQDTDSDTINDDVELANGTDPTDASDPPPPPLPTEGLIALYQFDETDGTTAFDAAVDDGPQDAEQNQGLVLWSANGLIGGALDLDGTSSLQAPDAIPQDSTAFSISGWIFPRAQGTYKGIYATRVVGGTPNFNWGLNVEGSLRGDLRFANANTSAGIDTPESLALDEWHHLAITYESDGVEATGKGYLNGVLAGTLATSGAGNIIPAYMSDGPYNIGDDPCCGGREFDGLIDDISVWSVALTDQDIAAIFLNGKAGIGIPPAEPVDFRITEFVRNPDGTVTLTWISHPFQKGTPDGEKPSYTVLFNNTLTVPLDEWPDDTDNVVSEGESTTYTTLTSFAGMPETFFAVRLNGQ